MKGEEVIEIRVGRFDGFGVLHGRQIKMTPEFFDEHPNPGEYIVDQIKKARAEAKAKADK